MMAEQSITDINQPPTQPEVTWKLAANGWENWEPSIVVAFLSWIVTDRFNSQMMEIIAP